MDLGGLGGLNGVGSRLQMLMLMPSDAVAVAFADDDAVVGVVVVVVVVVVDNEVLSRNCCEGWGVGLCSAGA